MATIGLVAVLLALISSLYAVIAALAGARRGSQLAPCVDKALRMVAILITLATIILFYLLVSHNFQVRYVYQYTSTHLPLIYTISAFWAGQEGSLLLWLWFLAVLTVVVVQRGYQPQKMNLYLLGILAFTEAFLALLLLVVENPFAIQAM